MFKKIVFTLLFAASTLANAESTPAAPAQGYQTLSPAQPTQDKSKVEVIEFFWYGCPHCYALEPSLNAWLKTLPKNVTFIRQPAMFWAGAEVHAKAYFVAESLGVVDKVHADLFDAIQNKKQKMDSEEELAKFFVAHGVKEAAFRDAYKSFGIDTKVKQSKTLAPRYGISGVPTLVVNGKYVTSASLAGSAENVTKILNQLIAQESAALPKK